jgi:hypothetical protein
MPSTCSSSTARTPQPTARVVWTRVVSTTETRLRDGKNLEGSPRTEQEAHIPTGEPLRARKVEPECLLTDDGALMKSG